MKKILKKFSLKTIKILSGNSQLGTLNPTWFFTMRNLAMLSLYNAAIEVLPPNIFNPLQSLINLNLQSNLIWEVNSGHFGSSVTSIRTINLHDNVVNMVDASLITSATDLNFLMLRGNVCSNQDFEGVSENLWVVLEYLRDCTDNFVVESDITCEYSFLQPEVYMCQLGSNNPRGFNGFTNIPGNHLQGQGSDNVGFVYANGANMRTIPTIICEQFPNTNQMNLVESRIEIISEASFRHCRNLQFLFLMVNLVRTIPDNTFSNSPQLQYLSATVNRISSIADNAFRGSAIETLDLANNRIETFNPRAYEAINGTLRFLDFANNQLRGFPYAAFERVSGRIGLRAFLGELLESTLRLF